MEKALVNKKCLLKKYPGKGGWTYTEIPKVFENKQNPFGWVVVRGKIDEIEINNYHLMPMSNGNLFLPVKAEIRKKTGKAAGDHVHVILYPCAFTVEIPEELQICLEDEPKALKTFLSYTKSEQKAFIDWIYASKKEETKIERIASTINKLVKGEKLYIQKF